MPHCKERKVKIRELQFEEQDSGWTAPIVINMPA
jgi:hypothetical protein